MKVLNRYGDQEYPHTRIDVFRESGRYRYPSREIQFNPKRENYKEHSDSLLNQLIESLGDIPDLERDKRIELDGLIKGTIIEVETVTPKRGELETSISKIPANFESPKSELVLLKSKRKLSRNESGILFVPDKLRERLKKQINKYGQDPGNKRRSNLAKFEPIQHFNVADSKSLFMEGIDYEDLNKKWWEIWVRKDEEIANQIIEKAKAFQIDAGVDKLIFPETTIIFLYQSANKIAQFVDTIPGAVSEIRLADSTTDVILGRRDQSYKQHEWVEEFEPRVIKHGGEDSVVCILDSGISAEHKLLNTFLVGNWAVDSDWGTDDHVQPSGHGTAIAGLVLYNDLFWVLNDSRIIDIFHKIESMKVVPPNKFPETDPFKYGIITRDAVNIVEISNSKKLRTYCLAISTNNFPSTIPSSWSGAIDQLAYGSAQISNSDDTDFELAPKRLFLIATGNVDESDATKLEDLGQIEDPSQSWNALTIGGFTGKDQLEDDNLKPIVPANHRSPFSLGSINQQRDLMPIKPEVLFEAGNIAVSEDNFCGFDSNLSLISTGSDHIIEPLIPFYATSAAVGVAGNFLGRLQTEFPELWPETHRALVIDSAKWTQPMKDKLIGDGAHWKNISKSKNQELIREFGYGVPNINRAISSTQNDATLIAQAEIQPFCEGSNENGVFYERHVYQLPWPKATLEKIESAIVTMKVTLSYFIDPNLTGKAYTRPDTYRSYGLRFELKKVGESDTEFRQRFSKTDNVSRSRGSGLSGDSKYWLLGAKHVSAGSLHCDLWRGHAVDLANQDYLVVYPVAGWWKNHLSKKYFDNIARYALVISLSVEENLDLYSEMSNIIENREIEIEAKSLETLKR